MVKISEKDFIEGINWEFHRVYHSYWFDIEDFKKDFKKEFNKLKNKMLNQHKTDDQLKYWYKMKRSKKIYKIELCWFLIDRINEFHYSYEIGDITTTDNLINELKIMMCDF